MCTLTVGARHSSACPNHSYLLRGPNELQSKLEPKSEVDCNFLAYLLARKGTDAIFFVRFM